MKILKFYKTSLIFSLLLIFTFSCKICPTKQTNNNSTDNCKTCKKFERHIKRHFKKNKDGYFELKGFFESLAIQMKDPKDNGESYPLKFECMKGKSKEYILSLFGQPSRLIYYDYLNLDVFVYCVNRECLYRKYYNGSVTGPNIAFVFDENGMLKSIWP